MKFINRLNPLKEHYIIIFILTFALVLRVLVVMKLGEMYDEYSVAGLGKIYWGGIKNLDFSENIWKINYEHPPVAKLIYGLAAVIQEKITFINYLFDNEFHPDKRYFLARLTSTLIGISNISLVYIISNKWFNKNIAVYSSIVLSLLPHFIVHNAIAGIETPQAIISTLFVYYFVEALKSNSYIKFTFSFFLLGIFFLTKFSAIFYIFFIIPTLFILKKDFYKSITFIKITVISILIFILTVYIFWPWLWFNPLNLLTSFNYFKNASSGEYFLGSNLQPPIYYYFFYFIATTPPVILLMFSFSLINIKKNLLILIVLIWFLTPFTISILGIKKDGIRYVFTYMPPLSILCGIGYYYFVNNFKIAFNKLLITVVVFFTVLTSLYKFFPYYLDYYNIIVGGSNYTYKNKLLDYSWWGEGIKESVLYVNNNYNNKLIYPLFKPRHTTPIFLNNTVLDDNKVENLKIEPDVIIVSENYFYNNSIKPALLNNYKLVKIFDVNNVPLVRLYEKDTNISKK